MATVVQGTALAFGIAADPTSLVTTKVSIGSKVEKKEAKRKDGVTVAVAYYNRTSDVSIDGYGTITPTLGNALSVTGLAVSLQATTAASIFVEEVTTNTGNEEFTTSNVKGMSFEGI